MSTLLRQHAEQQFAEELHELKKNETNPIPENWEMSPQSVVTYLMGGILKNGFEVSPKYIGNRRLMENCRGHPCHRPGAASCTVFPVRPRAGSASTWRQHIRRFDADSTGTAGTGEEAIRYGWNYARLLAEGRVEVPGTDPGDEGDAGRQDRPH